MAAMSSLEAVRRKIRSLQEQADAAEERAGRLQREVDQERALREEVGVGGGERPSPPPPPPTKWSPAARRGRLQRPRGANLGERREIGWSTLGAEQACGFLQLLLGCASRPASFPGEVSALAAKGSETWEQSRDGSSWLLSHSAWKHASDVISWSLSLCICTRASAVCLAQQRQ